MQVRFNSTLQCFEDGVWLTGKSPFFCGGEGVLCTSSKIFFFNLEDRQSPKRKENLQ